MDGWKINGVQIYVFMASFFAICHVIVHKFVRHWGGKMEE